jgi:hypothetical protein
LYSAGWDGYLIKWDKGSGHILWQFNQFQFLTSLVLYKDLVIFGSRTGTVYIVKDDGSNLATIFSSKKGFFYDFALSGHILF